MRCRIRLIAVVLLGMAALGPGAPRAAPKRRPSTIVCPKEASFAERLAAKEIRRYVYLRTGRLVPIVEDTKVPGGSFAAIVVGCKDRPVVKSLLSDPPLKTSVAGLGGQQYRLKTLRVGGGGAVLVAGGDPVGTLYGAYRLAEHMGVRFYMHGDVIPDKRIPQAWPEVDELGKPLFNLRGIQPFHDFPEGPDWWNADDYKAVLGQLPKMRMNFFALHTYPEGGVGPEPAVWIGVPGDIAADGRVKFSYPARHFATGNVTGAWGYRPTKTSDYTFGAAAMYERDDYGADYMQGTHPWTKMSAEDCSALFRRFGSLLRDVFTFARRLGIKTCIGTETPLRIPKPVRQRLQAAGKNPADPAVVKMVYEGIFRRIMQTHPLDYYWFWTPEGWTWGGAKDSQIKATLADFRAAVAAAKKTQAPFTLATCGWVLGPPRDRALFDNVLPKDMPMSCISRKVGQDPVEPGFARVKGRPKWAIPWLEDDPAMIIPQLWAGRMRRDAADALDYGCTGLMGIHWRTRILGPNVGALAQAAWDQSGWNPAFGKEPKTPAPKAKPPQGALGGSVAAFPDNPMADTDDDPLYQTVRYNLRGYRLNVPDGTCTVTLKFCEPHYGEKGKRVFGVKVQGKRVIDRLDVFDKVGKNRALDYTFKDVKVTGGQLVIDFVHVVEFPCIAAIVVEGPGATRKINCGGPAYKGYQADRSASPSDRGPRHLPAADFYADWARAHFGPEAAKPIAGLFAGLDGRLPRPSTWVGGPGGIRPDGRPWAVVSKLYAFVDKLTAMRPQVKGGGDLERFDYWLNNFRYLRAVARVNCTWARFNAAMKKVKAEKNPDARKNLARRLALPVRKDLVAQVADVHRYLLATVATPGGMGNVTNWQQHVMPGLLTGPGRELARILGEELPADAMPSKDYAGPPRLFVPVIRTGLIAGEPLKVKAVVLGAKPADAAVYWRSLGAKTFTKVPLAHVARGVYAVTLPPKATRADLEYYVEVKTDGKETLHFPATAPTLNQTVVATEGE